MLVHPQVNPTLPLANACLVSSPATATAAASAAAPADNTLPSLPAPPRPTPGVLAPTLAFLIARFLSPKSVLQAASVSQRWKKAYRAQVLRVRLHLPDAPMAIPAFLANSDAAAPAPLLWHPFPHAHHHVQLFHPHHHHEEAIEEQQDVVVVEEEDEEEDGEEEDGLDNDSDDDLDDDSDDTDSDEEEADHLFLPVPPPFVPVLAISNIRALRLLGTFERLEVLHFRNVTSAGFFTSFFETVAQEGICARLQSLTICSSPRRLVPAPSSTTMAGGGGALAASLAAGGGGGGNATYALLGKSGWIALAFLLRSGGLPSLKHLSLNNQGLGPQVVVHLAQCLGSPSRLLGLETIDLDKNPMGSQGMAALASHALTRWGHGLRSLRLSGVGCGVGGATALAQAVQSSLASHHVAWKLRTLDLSGNPNVGQSGGQAVAEMVSALPSLENLDLTRCEIGTSGAYVLANALAATPFLTYLGLGFCKLRDEGALALCGAFGDGSCPALQSLDLTMNGLTSVTAQGLVNAARQGNGLRHLVVLILSSNKVDVAGAELLIRGLKEGCPLLRHLNMWGNALPARREREMSCLRAWKDVELYY